MRVADATNDEIFNLVREELLAEHQTTVNALHETKATLALAETRLTDERISREESERLLVDTNVQLDESTRKAAQIEADLAEAYQRATDADKRATELEASICKLWFFIYFSAIPLALGGVLGWYTHSFIQSLITDPTKTWGVWAFTGAALILPLALASSLAPYYIYKHPTLNHWWLARILSVGKLVLAAPLTAAVTGSFQGGVWDGIKNLAGL